MFRLKGRAAVGSLDLDEEDEVHAVARAALSWGIVRLGAVLQDVEEECQNYPAEKLREANHAAVKDLYCSMPSFAGNGGNLGREELEGLSCMVGHVVEGIRALRLFPGFSLRLE